MNPHRPIATTGLVFFLLTACAQSQAAEPLDLSKAVLVAPQNDETPKAQRKAAQMLIEEIEKRTGIRLNRVERMPEGDAPVIALGDLKALVRAELPDFTRSLQGEPNPERFAIRISSSDKRPIVFCQGDGSRGVLYAAGRLLRELRMSPGKITLDSAFKLTSAPQ